MAGELSVIRSYLVPRPGSHWRWSSDGEAIVGPDGRTIVFRRELELVLKRQVLTGLPPLGPIVLLLAACRDSWPAICNAFGGLEEPLDRVAVYPEGQSPSAIDHRPSLNKIFALPVDLRTKPDAKAELVAAVLESVHERTTPALAAEIVTALEAGLAAEFLQTDVRPSSTKSILFEDVRVVEMGLRGFDAEGLRLRLATGLEREVLPAEIEEPLARKVRKLLDRLKDDRELSGLVRLARDLMAIVHLPRPLDVPDEMPVGGVSDISQRGTLDRLLISELAQDDDTLMLRLAMNEALYLRRETPPANPPRSRVIVLDCGLRLWGVPRVFATAVALSLAALTEPTIDLCALRPEGDRLEPVDLSTRQGLIEHLKVLRLEAHPARALADLEPHLAGLDGEIDTILITGDDVVADHEFRRELAEWNPEIGFLITVSRSGEFRLMRRTVHGTTVLREAKLALEKLLAPTPQPAAPLIDPKRAAELPAILRVTPFPLRLPHQLAPKRSWWVQPPAVLSVTGDRRLMLWDKPLRGGLQLSDRLPSRQVVWCRGAAENGRTQFVVGDTGKPQLWLVTADLGEHRCAVTGLTTSESPVKAVCDHAGSLFVIHKREIDLVDMYSGTLLEKQPIPSQFRWMQSRFFRAPDAWYALSYDGGSARFEKVVSYGEFADWMRVFAMFDVKGVQGPVGMCVRDGALYFTADRKLVPLDHSLPNVRQLGPIARDGRRISLTFVDKGPPELVKTVVVSTMDQKVHGLRGDRLLPLEPSVAEMSRPRSLRARFRSAGCYPGVVFLETVRGQVVILRYSGPHGGFALLPYAFPKEIQSRMQPFVPLPAASPGVGYRLSVAAFANGHHVYLDSRGLLHLKCPDPHIPEATFVMCDDDAAGWSADGRMWGKPYFLGSTPGVGAYEIQESILTPFTRGCL